MDSTTSTILVFLLIFIGGIGGYIFYVTNQMADAGWTKEKKGGKIKKKK